MTTLARLAILVMVMHAVNGCGGGSAEPTEPICWEAEQVSRSDILDTFAWADGYGCIESTGKRIGASCAGFDYNVTPFWCSIDSSGKSFRLGSGIRRFEGLPGAIDWDRTRLRKGR